MDDRRGWIIDVGSVNGWMTDVGGVNRWKTDMGNVYSKYRFSSRATCTGQRASLTHREGTRTVSIYGVPGVNQCSASGTTGAVGPVYATSARNPPCVSLKLICLVSK